MKYFKKLYSGHRYFFNSVFMIFLLLIIILNLFELEFSGIKNSDTLAPVWYFITAGGGVYGIAVTFILFAVYVFKIPQKNKISKKETVLFLAVVLFVQLLNTGIIYFVLKDSYKTMRPSQLYITDSEITDPDGILFFTRPSEEKKKYLKEKTELSQDRFTDIYPPVLNYWINETENSFPSGHSQSSFFIGVMFAFVISSTAAEGKIYLSVIPLLWAMLVSVSRVVLGVHYNIDVFAGAAIGILAAILLISIKKINILFER